MPDGLWMLLVALAFLAGFAYGVGATRALLWRKMYVVRSRYRLDVGIEPQDRIFLDQLARRRGKSLEVIMRQALRMYRLLVSDDDE